MHSEFAVIVPAYCPEDPLDQLVAALSPSVAAAIVIVDDGSGPEYRARFDRLAGLPKVHILRHALNFGKGAALKTAFNHVLCELPELAGVVTADADGQHTAEDILRVGASLILHRDSLILGARRFDAAGIPFRSRIGNQATRRLVQLLVGQRLSDTQTGLRGIPLSLLPSLLRITASGYDFELEMLIAAKHLSVPVREEPVQTIYIEGNRSSHFNPLFDSMRIWFTLLRFSILSLLTALLDNVVFLTAFSFTGNIAAAQVCGRVAAVLFNYTAVRKLVFLSRQSHHTVLPRYLLLVFTSGLLSYSLIRFFTSTLGIHVMPAKILAEGLIFIANFTIQRDFIFAKRDAVPRATDWANYYAHVPFTAKLTRKYTSGVLLGLFRKFMDAAPPGGVVVEIGGANSCFLDRIQHEVQPRQYYVIDNNEYGLGLLRERVGGRAVQVLREDVLDLQTSLQADLVFSVGLIEHFSPANTRRAVLAHFDLLRPGGHAIITFPTPTLLYRVARGATELLGLWKFPDERPLRSAEVLAIVRERGQVLQEKLLWPLVFTQALIVVRKQASSAPAE